MAEVSYVGTRGRNLVSRRNGNVMPFGALNTGTFNGIDLSNPGQPLRGRDRVDQPGELPDIQRLQRHKHRLRRIGPICLYGFDGVSNYDSMQFTLEPSDRPAPSSTSSPTPSAAPKARSAASTRRSIPTMPSRTYGVLNEDRTHTS